MPKSRQVYLLAIAHRHGESLSVYTTHRAATLSLYLYVRDWWQETFADEPRPLDGHPQAAIDAYFAKALDERYDISAETVYALEDMLVQFPDKDGDWVWQPAEGSA